jgi:putative membrane protein
MWHKFCAMDGSRHAKGPAMKSLLIILTAIASTLLVPAAAIGKDVPPPDKFLGEAIQDGRAEVQTCNLALQKSGNPDVKSFAQRMIKDHTATNNKIEALAKSKNIALPEGISVKQKATYELLSKSSGTRFDEAFMDHNVSDHETDVKNFTEQANGATDPDVKAFAAETLKTLKEHLQLARDVRAKVKKSP